MLRRRIAHKRVIYWQIELYREKKNQQQQHHYYYFVLVNFEIKCEYIEIKNVTNKQINSKVEND